VQMIMIPLVMSSIIQGIVGEGGRARLAELGPRVGAYFVGTTLVAIVVGLTAALIVRPGRGQALLAQGHAAAAAATTAAPRQVASDLPSVISALLPTNPLASMLAGEMLSIVIVAMIIGVALVTMDRDRADPLLAWFFSIQEICMTVTRWAMRLAPLAVFGLVARTVAQSGFALLAGLGLYVATVLGALLIIVALYALLIALATPVSPRRFFVASKDVLVLAFSVASSAAVMPLTMKTAEEKLGVPPSVARFIVPVGAIMNMNGTAAYQAIATVFLAQSYGIDLSLPALALIAVTTAAASIGTPSTPGAGIVILATVLASAGIPAEGISLILGVDYLLGMFRTSVNVAGDLTGCVLFAGREDRRPASTAAS
jgi:Na+/H+-dicarboxylate symporter